MGKYAYVDKTKCWYHGAKGNGAGAGIVNGDGVVQTGDDYNCGGPESGSQEHAADPFLASILRVLAGTRVSRNHRRKGIYENGGGHDTGALGPLLSKDSIQDHQERSPCELVSCPDKRCKRHWAGGGSEHITVNLFPSIVISEVMVLYVNKIQHMCECENYIYNRC